MGATSTRATLGIAGFGAYLPPLRVAREEIAAANAWVNPSLRSLAKGHRSVAGWDEDAITMAVDASREALAGLDRPTVGAVYLGSTTHPFADRLNAGVVAAAVGLSDCGTAQDVSGSHRAGTGALRVALDTVAARGAPALAVASERRRTPAASAAELIAGHGAAGVVVAEGAGLARLAGSASVNVDFVDHFRRPNGEFDYQWEERWIREEGYLKIVPRAVAAALADGGIEPGRVDRFAIPCPLPRVDRAVARRIGIAEEAVVDNLAANCGDTGAAHPLLLLAAALESAKPRQVIVVAGFGQGADVFVFEATDALPAYLNGRAGLRRWLRRERRCTYPRYLALCDLVKIERGIRAEADRPTALTTQYRHTDLVNGFVGGRCRRCGTHQVPRMRVCVNPDCRAIDSQDPHSFAESTGRVVSWSADSLTYSPDPPAYYGMIDFMEGGRLMMDFTDVTAADLLVGSPMRMVFRIHDQDPGRNYTRYFWKATPVTTGSEEA